MFVFELELCIMSHCSNLADVLKFS